MSARGHRLCPARRSARSRKRGAARRFLAGAAKAGLPPSPPAVGVKEPGSGLSFLERAPAVLPWLGQRAARVELPDNGPSCAAPAAAPGLRRRGLLALLPCLGTWPLTASPATPRGPAPSTGMQAPAGDDGVRRGRVLQFPRDHGAHLGAAIEWWYLTGELHPVPADASAAGAAAVSAPVGRAASAPAAAGGAAAGPFGFQITFFRSRTGLGAGLDGRFVPRQLLFAHAALTDLGAGRHRHAQRIARWSGAEDAALARASARDTDLLLGGWTLRRADGAHGSVYRTRFGDDAGAQRFSLELELRAALPPLLQGDAGFSRKGPDEAQASHYVSEPQLAAAGTLQLGGRTLAVRGRGWLDHEWSDALLPAAAVGWDWIGINLDDGAALTAFQLRRADGSALWAGGSWRAADGAVRAFGPAELRFEPGRIWRSPATGAAYPVQWQITTPAGRFSVQALLDAQELDSRGSTGTVYWEGLSELRDAAGRRLGRGYLEMTGYAGRLALG